MTTNGIVLLDGSCGSALWNMADAKGIRREPVWKYNLTEPEMVLQLHRSYLEAGSDWIQTNTFSLNRTTAEREAGFQVAETVKAASEIALKAANEKKKTVYFSVGPLPVLLSPYGKLSPEACREEYDELFEAAASAGIRCAALETFMDLRMLEIAASSALSFGLKTICSMTFEKRHRTMMGDTIEKICSTLAGYDVAAVGMNCSYGPAKGMEIIREFREKTDLPLYFKPNAGMGTEYTARQFAQEIAPAFGFVSYIGGCCGTDAAYIRELRTALDSFGDA